MLRMLTLLLNFTSSAVSSKLMLIIIMNSSVIVKEVKLSLTSFQLGNIIVLLTVYQN